MLYDSGVNDNQRILIFGLPEIVSEFDASYVNLYDGNFSMAFQAFSKVFVMRLKFIEDHIFKFYAKIRKKFKQQVKFSKIVWREAKCLTKSPTCSGMLTDQPHSRKHCLQNSFFQRVSSTLNDQDR